MPAPAPCAESPLFRKIPPLLLRGVHLFVDDPQCSDLILYQVGRHFERLMTRETGSVAKVGLAAG